MNEPEGKALVDNVQRIVSEFTDTTQIQMAELRGQSLGLQLMTFEVLSLLLSISADPHMELDMLGRRLSARVDGIQFSDHLALQDLSRGQAHAVVDAAIDAMRKRFGAG